LNDLTIPVLGNGTVLSKLSPHMELASIVQMVLSVTTILVTSSIFVTPDVPGCLPKTFPIVFYDVQLHTDRRVVALDVTVARRRPTLWGNGVEIVVDSSLRATNIHVKLYVTAKEIPRCAPMHATFAVNSPSITLTRNGAPSNVEVTESWTVGFTCGQSGAHGQNSAAKCHGCSAD
jgi:hypothetical protein